MIMIQKRVKNNMKLKDMRQAVGLLQKEWNLGQRESGATGNICALIYLMQILEETERLFVYREADRLIGFAGYSNVHSRKHLLKKKFYGLVEHWLWRSKKIHNKEALRGYFEKYDYLPEEMKDCFDGEVSILLVDPEYRGRGIGKKLLLDVFVAARIDGMKNLEILTDESCNFRFYEYAGCAKVYETVVDTEKAYVYETSFC